jgi:hypothetical protein
VQDLPEDFKELLTYAKALHFNKKMEQIIVHIRIRSSIPLGTIKEPNSAQHTEVKNKLCRFLTEFNYWITTHYCAVTRILHQRLLICS